MNTKNKIIGISGVKGSGKDVAAIMFQYCLSVPKIFRQYWIFKLFGKRLHKSWKITAFANPLKKMLSILLNIPISSFNSRTFKEQYCIDFNTLKVNNINNIPKNKLLSDSTFTKKAKNLDTDLYNYCLTIRQLMQLFGTECCRRFFGPNIWINCTLNNLQYNTIVSDVRFTNEAEAIKNKSGKIFYIDRGLEFGAHPSEKEMQTLLINGFYDNIIPNFSTLKSLFDTIKQYCNDI